MIGGNIQNEVSSRGIREESWCTTKHLLHAEGHLEEEIANASRHAPELLKELAETLNTIRELRQKSVKRVLGVRENENVPAGDCPRCSADLEIVKRRVLHSDLYKVDDKNNTVTKKNISSKEDKIFMDDLKALVVPVGGQFLGAAAYDQVNKRITTPIGGYPASTLVNLVGGIAVAYGAMTMVDDETMKEALALVGTHMVGRQLYDLVGTSLGGAGIRAPIMIAPYSGVGAAQRTYPGTKVQVF